MAILWRCGGKSMGKHRKNHENPMRIGKIERHFSNDPERSGLRETTFLTGGRKGAFLSLANRKAADIRTNDPQVGWLNPTKFVYQLMLHVWVIACHSHMISLTGLATAPLGSLGIMISWLRKLKREGDSDTSTGFDRIPHGPNKLTSLVGVQLAFGGWTPCF